MSVGSVLSSDASSRSDAFVSPADSSRSWSFVPVSSDASSRSDAFVSPADSSRAWSFVPVSSGKGSATSVSVCF